MRLAFIILLTILLLSGCNKYKFTEQTNEYIVVNQFDQFLKTKFGINVSDEKFDYLSGKNNLVVFFDLKDSLLYLNKNYSRNNLDDIFYETWYQKSYLIVVCDPRATSSKREAYYSLYHTFFKVGQRLLNDRALEKYGKNLTEIDNISRRKLGLAGVPFVLYTEQINDTEYLQWVDNFASDKERWKRGIPMDLIP